MYQAEGFAALLWFFGLRDDARTTGGLRVCTPRGHASHRVDEGWGFLAAIVDFPETEA